MRDIILAVLTIIVFLAIINHFMNMKNNNVQCILCFGSKNCVNCILCFKCNNCHRCIDCTNCKDCTWCTDCMDCKECTKCISCTRHIKCRGLMKCENMTNIDGWSWIKKIRCSYNKYEHLTFCENCVNFSKLYWHLLE